MDATGAVHTATPEADPHFWRALTVSVGRLGIILEVTFAIVPNASVRRTKTVCLLGGRTASWLRVCCP